MSDVAALKPELIARKLREITGRSRVNVRLVESAEQSDEHGLVLPRIIWKRGRAGGYTHVICHGELGAGKSTYAFHVCWQLVNEHIYTLPEAVRKKWRKWSIDEQYEWILENLTAYTVQEFLEIIQRHTWKKRAPCVIWDDAGVHGSSLLFFTDRRAYQALSALFQVIRTRAMSVIITAPLKEFIAKQVREIPESIIVIVERVDDRKSRALGFRQRQGVKRQYYELEFIDFFERRLPEQFYKQYSIYRDNYVTDVLGLWMRLLEERGAKAKA